MAEQMVDMLLGALSLQENGTVTSYPHFNAEADAIALHGAMKGMGTDERSVIDVTANRSNAQRQEIKSRYKQTFGKDLVDDLQSETSGRFRDLLSALYEPAASYDASCLHKAMKGAGTDEDVLTDIMASRSNREIREIKKVFKTKFRQELEEFISRDTGGFYKRLLVALCNASRDETDEVDVGKAKEDAAVLLRAGEKRAGTDEAAFIAILCTRSRRQLNAVVAEYETLAGKELVRAIDSEFSGDIGAGLRAVVESSKCKPAYFAKLLHRTMKGLGTNDSELIRLIVSRSEVDLGQIKQAFATLYGKLLEDWVKGDTSGDYRRLLLAILHES